MAALRGKVVGDGGGGGGGDGGSSSSSSSRNGGVQEAGLRALRRGLRLWEGDGEELIVDPTSATGSIPGHPSPTFRFSWQKARGVLVGVCAPGHPPTPSLPPAHQ